jgi:enoyl-CoA hydratase
MNDASQEDLLVERRGAVLLLTFNRPHARNALTLAGARRMVAALKELDDDPELRVAVLAGAGGNFCSGMDLKAFLHGERPYVEGYGYAGFTERAPHKPMIAAVEGYALAGGFEAALACDIIVASREAKFGLPEVKRGLVAAAGGLMRLPRRIPYHIAMQHVLTGEMMSAQSAAHWGLVNELVEPGGALAAAMTLAKRISENAPLAVMASKHVVSESGSWQVDDMFERQANFIDHVFHSEDAQEGSKAFAEKRLPCWAGR